MIDIHTHIVPFVDDGSSNLESSIKMIRDSIDMGITDIICTPHYRKNMFTTPIEVIKDNFNKLLEEVKRQRLDIRIYLGMEIYISRQNQFKELLDKNLIIPMNNTDYYLLEFPYTTNVDISEIIYEAKLLSKKVIIAHIERYKYITLDDMFELKANKALIQVNASSICGKHGHKIKRKVLKAIKHDLVDFIASDIHESRVNYYNKAIKKVSKKFNFEICEKHLFLLSNDRLF